MEEQYNSSASPPLSSSSSSSAPTPPSSVANDSREDSSNMNVLSSFLNASREIGNYSANFTDLLKPTYNESTEGQVRGDGEVPQEDDVDYDSGTSTKKRKALDDVPALGIGEDKELSVDDKKAIKKQRRLAKNREAAQLFRQRQKEYISNLEARANQLIAANTEANARAELIASENKLMREQLAYLRNFMKQAVSFSYPYGGQNTPTPTSPAGMVPLNPFMAGFMPPNMSAGVDAMGNFVESSHHHAAANVGLPSSVPLADGTSISFNLMPSSSSAPPSFMSYTSMQGGNPLYAGGVGSHNGGAVKNEKQLSPD